MTTFRPTDEMLAFVRRRATSVRRRRRAIAGSVAIVTVGAVGLTALAIDDRRERSSVTVVAPAPIATTAATPKTEQSAISSPPTPVPPEAPAAVVELLDPASVGLTSTFAPYFGTAGPAGYVVTGDNVPFVPGEPQSGLVWFSPDGRGWEPVGDEVFETLGVRGVVATEARYLLGARDWLDGGTQLFVSEDGRSWQQAALLEDEADWANLFAAGGRFFRFSSEQMLTSVDGTTWEPAVTDDGSAFDGYGQIVHTGTEFIALQIGAGQSSRLFRSGDGVTWTPGPAPQVQGTIAGVATANGVVVVAIRAEPDSGGACQFEGTGPPPPPGGAPSGCEYHMSFATLDIGTGQLTSSAAPAFATQDESPYLIATPWGWLALSREGEASIVWTSRDGLSWVPGAQPIPRHGGDRPVVVGADIALVITDSQTEGARPQVVLVSSA